MRFAFLFLFVAIPAFAQNAPVPMPVESAPVVRGRLLRVETYELDGRRVAIEESTDATERTQYAKRKAKTGGGGVAASGVVQSPTSAPPAYTLHNGAWWIDRGLGWEYVGMAVQQYPRTAYSNSYSYFAGDCAGGG